MTDLPRCQSCGLPARYAFAGPGGARDLCCRRHAVTYPRVRDRALRIAAVVGAILLVINQLDVVLAGHLTPLVAAKIALTFGVPYSVSTYSALEVNRI